MSTAPVNYAALDEAIAAFEGFGTAGTPATVNNNPGNLVAGAFATSYGATGTSSQGFAVFPSAAQGVAAEDALVGYYANQGDSIADLISNWAPPTATGNSATATSNYTNYVANTLGVSTDTPISQTSNLGLSATNGTPTSLSSPLGTGVTNAGSVSAVNPLSPSGSSTIGLSSGTLSTLGTLFGPIGTFLGGISGSGFSWGRIGAFVLGLIVIAGALYLFKPVQNVVNTAARRVGEAAAES